MIWFYYFIIIIIGLLCPISSSSSSIANQLVAATYGNGGRNKSCFHKEKQALLDFKASLEDPLGRLSTWRAEDDDCCKWSGVICNNETPHVTELHQVISFDGSRGGLRGEVNPSLLNLTYLNYLDLSKNNFNGSIPNFIGSMTQLRYLDLSYNNFNGTIPRTIGSLTQLWYLDLFGNYFHGTIPPEFGNLTNLSDLSLGSYETIENLDWLSNLSHLQTLQMYRISLAKANYWVDVILSLPKLSFLNFEGCDLSEVMHPYSSSLNSTSSSSSSSIEYLYLEHNNLNSSMYPWLFPLTSNRLVYLRLSGNMLDRIPKYLGNLCSLTSLHLNENSAIVNFTDFLNNLSGCTSVTLQGLYASNSQFTGSLSNEIQQISSLEYLYLSRNHLNGTMSEKVWELPNLQTLDVSSNSLIISPNIGRSKLSEIDLSNNSIVVTPSKAHMENLYYVLYISLSACNIGPLFPKWILTHKSLTTLDMSNNRISNIPVEFWNMWPSQLIYLNLSSNNISGEAPDLTSNFGSNSVIDLSSNAFYGPIPKFSPFWSSLNLSKNKFYGGISVICQTVNKGLLLLDLSHNSLTGQIPDCLWQFEELRVLNLGHNNFSGRLPASIGYLDRLEVLHLYNNNFSGEFPLSLKICTKLKFLNLGANKFFGNVPVWVGENLTELYGVILRSNNFFGPIPLQLCYLMNLQILDLSINNLNGTIPSCVSNLKALKEDQGRLGQQNIHHPMILTSNVITPGINFIYFDNAMVEWQGNEREFTKNLGFLRCIDLSSNNLTGHIPNELTDLNELLALNLSKNALLGEIPRRIGEMKQLLTLDLSRNKFSGGIPSSMSQMAFLSYLDLSHNRLSGRIPTGTQLQLFERSRYTGNAGLCGPPITKSCPGDEVPSTVGGSESSEEGTEELERWFYIGGSIGFATGFWMACGALLLNRHGRHAFFPFVDFVKDWIYVKVVVFVRKLERVAHS